MYVKLFAALISIMLSLPNQGSKSETVQPPANRISPYAAHQAHCLAEAVYHESRGESLEGQAAVARVVLNRSKFPKAFGDSICKVVYQKGQFTWSKHERLDWNKHENSTVFNIILARSIVWNIEDSLGVKFTPKSIRSATFFSHAKPQARGLISSGVVGHHHFYYNLNLIASKTDSNTTMR
jgi:hypothetical protein